MFSRNKNQKEKKKRDPAQRQHDLFQFGFLDETVPGSIDETEADDAALEAELLAITGGGNATKPKKSKQTVAPEVLNQMVSECLKSDDEEVSDSEDPELLDELSALVSSDDETSSTPAVTSPTSAPVLPATKSAPVIVRPSPITAGPSVVSLLEERIFMYKEAEDNAVAAGETSRARRFNRGLKTLNQMMKNVKGGKAINEEDIPPPVLSKSSRSNSALNLAQENESVSSGGSVKATISQNVAFNSSSQLRKAPQPPAPAAQPNIDSIQQVIADPTSQSRTYPTPQLTTGTNVLPSAHPTSQPPIPQSRTNVNPSSHVPANSHEPRATEDALSLVLRRQSQYKLAALEAKKLGDKEKAISFLRISKQMNPLIEAAKNGVDVDLHSLPPLPGRANELSDTKTSGEPPLPSPPQPPPVPPETSEAAQSTPGGPPQPATALEALEQRLAKYMEQKEKAQREGNARKERMNQRIINQYREAIQLVQLGRYVDFEELPKPPGFAPIPAQNAAPVAAPPTEPPIAKPQNERSPAKPRPAASQPPKKPVDVRRNPQSTVERQLSVLKKRQQQFREAALDSKKRGEIEQAKEYLRNSRGIEQLVTATESGLPVDMNTVPIPPQEAIASFRADDDLGFEVIAKDDCQTAPPSTPADISLIYTKIEEDLIEQIKTCAHTREHFKALGDVASANRFEQLILHTKKDLDAVRVAFKRGDQPPKFHYETRSFTMIKCNTDLSDSDFEISVVRGINFNVPNPKEVDTYVKYEFPYPPEVPQQGKTDVVKDTNSPEFNHKVVYSMDRKSRAVARTFKRRTLNCTVVAKGRWFHRDSDIGSIKVPLVPLENQCTLHETYDLLDEKKKMVGGKLEVKIRMRNPILSKQMEKVSHKWLVVDGF